MTLATEAREAAGLTLAQAARRARVGTAYLRRIERHGAAPYVLAVRLAGLYGCRMDVFLQGQPQRPQRAGAGRNPPRRHIPFHNTES